MISPQCSVCRSITKALLSSSPHTTGTLHQQSECRGALKSKIFYNPTLNLGCGVAQIVARRLAVRQARVRISARHPSGGSLPSGKQGGQQEWCSTSSIYKILYVCSINVKINKKSGSVPPNL
jgi:hypothetical protein